MDWSYINDFFRITRYTKKMNKFFLSIPIIFIIIISIFLLIFLLQEKDPSKPPSALLSENLPQFKLINLFDDKQHLTNENIDNQITLINFFASWCTPCKAEHPLFFEIKKQYPQLYLLGIDMKDEDEKAIEFLSEDGNPYDYVGVDRDGYIAIEFGVVGLPETFLINKNGKIVYKYLGPLTKEIINDEIKPLL